MGVKNTALKATPNWYENPFRDNAISSSHDNWVISLNDIKNDDPKHYWELSRFYWAPRFALRYIQGSEEYGAMLEQWAHDWAINNPPYSGVHWACGQEAAIRLMNLALAAKLLGNIETPSNTLKWLIEAHAKRIKTTLSYAIAQDNNHGSAEAAALFVAGSWGQNWGLRGAKKYKSLGKKWLNNRALRLIQPDGSPCQYSTTYHRANLEVFSFAKYWADHISEPLFSEQSKNRILDGTRWLHAITNSRMGDAPNIGANDGSHLFNITDAPYRDFRPTVALAAAVFSKSQPWRDYSDRRVYILDIPTHFKKNWEKPVSKTYPDGGFHILRQGYAMALLRFPNFRFRPSQADALHVDLWLDDKNILRDGGTYSYVKPEGNWFSGTAAHNTITFDNRDQMPKISRFLFGNWLKPAEVENVQTYPFKTTASAAYKDDFGMFHKRKITLTEDALICHDRVSGAFREARLNWRLNPGNWAQEASTFQCENVKISIKADHTDARARLGETWESQFYEHKETVPLLSLAITEPDTITTTVQFAT